MTDRTDYMAEHGVPRGDALRDAAERVCWFDWSGNDEDAVKAVDDLRAVLARPQTDQRLKALARRNEFWAEMMKAQGD